MEQKLGTTTYDPQDDKLRFYYFSRLDKEIWDEFKKAGFGYAPKQGCLFQVWSPLREDTCLKYSDEITEEESSLQERAELRFDRYVAYKENARDRADKAKEAVDTLTNGIPLGQPILVGHHSEKRARKDAERIENGLRRYVDELESADYWSWRAKGVLSHASYMERPDVIARRIKKLKAEIRKFERERMPQNMHLDWVITDIIRDDLGKPWEFERKDLTEEEKEIIRTNTNAIIARRQAFCDRWLKHLRLRLTFEEAIYSGKGGIASDKKELTPGGAALFLSEWREIIRVNKNREGMIASATIKAGITETWRKSWVAQVDDIKGIMTPAEWEQYRAEGRPVKVDRYHYQPNDVHEELTQAREMVQNGVQVVVQNQLFPTPPHIVDHMIHASKLTKGMSVLEPSAGTGAIVKRLTDFQVKIDVCEVNETLANQLSADGFNVVANDFLTYNNASYDIILMNPPFANHQDIHHVQHAFELLKAGGRLVSIMGAGSVPNDFSTSGRRIVQEFGRWLKWNHANVERLADDCFQESGTNVNTVMVTIWKGF